MPLYKLEELNYVELEELVPANTVFFLVISPLEEHAPHLPLGTDVFIAQYFAQKTAEELSQNRPDWNVVLLAPLAVEPTCLNSRDQSGIRFRLSMMYFGDTESRWPNGGLNTWS